MSRPQNDDEQTFFTEAAAQYHRLTIVNDETDMVVGFQIGANFQHRRANFVAAVLTGHDMIVLAESDIDWSASWEVRGSGLWADHNCEQPMVHWTYGLEAFALRIEAEDELIHRGFGERLPLGWELDFEADAEPIRHTNEASEGYAQTGRGHGVVLIGTGQNEIDGQAIRQHWWGSQPLPTSSYQINGPTTSPKRVALPTETHMWWLSIADDSVSWTSGAPKR